MEIHHFKNFQCTGTVLKFENLPVHMITTSCEVVRIGVYSPWPGVILYRSQQATVSDTFNNLKTSVEVHK